MVSEQAKQRMRAVAAHYPTLRSAILPALHIAQSEEGYLTQNALESVAEALHLNPDEVKSVATFYTMFFKEQPGKRVIKVCTSISCYLRGCDQLMTHLEERLGIKRGETTPDGRFTLLTTECLASCGTAPVLQVNDEFVENVTLENTDALLKELNQEIEQGLPPRIQGQTSAATAPGKAGAMPAQSDKAGKNRRSTPASSKRSE
jgi:NADH-quinone oxidoreductase E subunit